jgi:hypothetical protein
MGNLVHRVNVLLLLLPSSTMGSEDKGQRTELTRKGRERRATIPFLCCLVSEQHHQQQQRSKADARARLLPQEVDELDVYNMDRLQVELEALDLRMDISLHLRMSSSPLLPKTAPPAGPPPVRVLLEERPPPVRDHLDSLIILTTGVETPLGLMLKLVQSHLVLRSLRRLAMSMQGGFPVLLASTKVVPTTCEGFTAVRQSRFGHSEVATMHRDGDKPEKIPTTTTTRNRPCGRCRRSY